jgi:hypothetical protein
MFRTRELKGSNNAAMRAFHGHEAHMPRAAGKTFAKSRVRASPYLNFGICGTEIRGGGNVAILEVLPIPLGSTATLFIPPAFAGPCGMPLIGTFPVAAEPALRGNCANEAAGKARIMRTAKATFAEVFDIEVFGMAQLHL